MWRVCMLQSCVLKLVKLSIIAETQILGLQAITSTTQQRFKIYKANITLLSQSECSSFIQGITFWMRLFGVVLVFLLTILTDKTVSLFEINSTTCPYIIPPATPVMAMNFCPNDTTVVIRTHAVKQNGVIMQGWLHFEIELMDTTDNIVGIYVQVRDEWYNAIGEFVYKPEEQCNSTNPDLIMPTSFQVMPCNAVGYREAKVSNALFMLDPSMLDNKTAGMPFLTSRNISKSRGIHFTWRLSEYWCNRHLRFRPEAVIFTEKMLKHNYIYFGTPKIYRKAAEYWLFPGWYRAADIKLDGTKLTCDEKVIDYTPRESSIKLEENSGALAWLLPDAEQSTYQNDYINPWQQYLTPGTSHISFKSCHADPRNGPDNRRQPTFSGRCKHHYEKDPSHDALQGCNLDGDAPEFDKVPKDLETYDHYVHTLTINRTKQCTTPCRVPINMEDLIAIQKFNSSSGPKKETQMLKFTNIGATRHDSKVKKFWAARKFHGQVLTFWSMFLLPVGTFAARYLKETAMKDVCIGCHLWFWIHMATLLLGGGLLGCGYLALHDLINTFGRSRNEFSGYHRILSVSSIVIFILMAVLGVFRTTSIKVRHVILFLHSFLGFLVYFLNLGAMVLSSWIPASPSMYNDCDENGRPIGLSLVAIVTMGWLVLDILCHIGMTVLQIVVDRRYGVVRHGIYFPIIPFLSPNSIKDLKGKTFRKIIFLVYTIVAFALAMTVIFMLSEAEIKFECKNNTGPTTCEDPWGCSNWAKAYSKRYPQGPTKAPEAAN